MDKLFFIWDVITNCCVGNSRHVNGVELELKLDLINHGSALRLTGCIQNEFLEIQAKNLPCLLLLTNIADVH